MHNNYNRIKICQVIYVAALIGIFCGCKSNMSDKVTDVPTLKFEEAPDFIRFTDRFVDISCVQLEMTDESVIGRIHKIIPYEAFLIVFADNDIYLFNKADGKYIRTIGSIGEGPEEYLQIEDIVYDPATKLVMAFDRMRNDLVSYGLDGSFSGKRKLTENLPWVESIERASDGTMLACNCLSNNEPFSAFTKISGNGDMENIDPFSPIIVDNCVSRWGTKPMSSCGNEIKFVKMFTDTLFQIRHDKVSPIYKLDLGRNVPSKETIAQFGPFPGNPDYLAYCLDNKLSTGIDQMYETSEFVILIPHVSQDEGYYLIDKKDYSGYRIKSSSFVDRDTKRASEGKSLINLIGSNENELISCFKAELLADSFTEGFAENEENIVFPADVVETIRNVDRDGNPFLIIYSHK